VYKLYITSPTKSRAIEAPSCKKEDKQKLLIYCSLFKELAFCFVPSLSSCHEKATVALKGVSRKISRGEGGNGKKDRKLAKNSTICLFQGEPSEKKRPKYSKKRPKNNTFMPLSTIFVPCLKFQGGTQWRS